VLPPRMHVHGGAPSTAPPQTMVRPAARVLAGTALRSR
jgi:hypothetical protein